METHIILVRGSASSGGGRSSSASSGRSTTTSRSSSSSSSSSSSRGSTGTSRGSTATRSTTTSRASTPSVSQSVKGNPQAARTTIVEHHYYGSTPYFPYSYGGGFNPWFYMYWFDRPAYYEQTAATVSGSPRPPISTKDKVIGGAILITILALVGLTAWYLIRKYRKNGSHN